MPNFLNIQYIFYRIYLWIFGPVGGTVEGRFTASAFQQFLVLLRIFLIFLGIAFLIGAAYAAYRLHEIRKKTRFVLAEVEPGDERAPRQDQWDEVMKHVGSENPSDWKLAVLEADTILDELTKSLNVPGDTLGERLRNSVPGDFKTLDDAWEAHKVRNQIAHEGLNFALTKREARIAIDRFEKVFREFHLIR